jgi:hypothetical protein
MTELNIKLDFNWEKVLSSQNEPYTFPNDLSDYMKKRYNLPAIYRWLVYHGDKLESVYIGEAEILCPRRIYHYLHPGPSQMTNIRINELFTQLVNEGRKITLEILVFKEFVLDGKAVSISDLYKKTVRVFLEHLMMVHHENSGVMSLNKAIK